MENTKNLVETLLILFIPGRPSLCSFVHKNIVKLFILAYASCQILSTNSLLRYLIHARRIVSSIYQNLRQLYNFTLFISEFLIVMVEMEVRRGHFLFLQGGRK